MTPSALMRGGRKSIHTRDSIIEALKRYAELYGPDFTAAAFSPSTAKWRDEPDIVIERYMAGDPVTGKPWPSLNSIKAPFGGFNAARAAAGLAPNRPGPAKRRAGEHKPVRTVSHVTRTIYLEKDSGELAKAIARAERAEARVARLRADAKTKTPKATKTSTKTVEGLAAARASAREARATATRLASRLERAEATIATLREERRGLRLQLTQASTLVDAAKASVEIVEVEKRVEVPVDRVVEKIVKVPVEKIVERPHPGEATIADAELKARTAYAELRTANARADAADAAYAELVEAVDGSKRRLTAAELRELRTSGPAGPAVLATALKDLAKTRKKAVGGHAMKVALTAVAAAAIGWRDRL